MTVEIRTVIVSAKTGEQEIIIKEKELMLTPPPPVPDGYRLEEWMEETDTQLIQHWNVVPIEATAFDYEAALKRLGVNV